MIKRQKWVDHKFNLGIDIGWTSNVMSRIEDTALRIEHYCQGLSEEQLSKRITDAWSIKEHIGHLTDLEELWKERFQEFPKGNSELVMADMSNKKTETSKHNTRKLEYLLANFKEERSKLIATYDSLSLKSQNHKAIHPRIKMSMRPVDLLFFVAEHDDHHLSSIKEIIKGF